MKSSVGAVLMVVLFVGVLSAAAAGCSTGSGCPADEGLYEVPKGICLKDGDTCSFGDTSCINVYVCEDHEWKDKGCNGDSSNQSGAEAAGANGATGGVGGQ